MIKYVNGNLLTVDANVICHQVNFDGVMGAGIARAIWNQLEPIQRAEYVGICRSYGPQALGRVQYMSRPRLGKNHFVANLFSQRDWNDIGPDGYSSLTDYDAFRACMEDVEEFARERLPHRTVAVPDHIGCGIAGGSWAIVEAILHEVFDDSPITCSIIKWVN